MLATAGCKIGPIVGQNFGAGRFDRVKGAMIAGLKFLAIYILIVAALLIDLSVLTAMVARTSEFGFSPNKTAALGENIILLVNLAWAGWLSAGFIRGTRRFRTLEQWQTRYVPVYALWAALVVIVFPPLFGFR